MFSGDERASIATEVHEEDFYQKVQDALEPLGDVEVSEDGDISISPNAAMTSFASTLNISGKVKSTDDGYKVDVSYDLSPSAVLWIGAIALGCFVFPIVGFVAIIAPLVLDKPNVQKATEKALRDLKDEFGKKKSKSKARAGDDDDDDDA